MKSLTDAVSTLDSQWTLVTDIGTETIEGSFGIGEVILDS